MCTGYIQSEQLKVFIKSILFPVAVFQNSSRNFFQPCLAGVFFSVPLAGWIFIFFLVDWMEFFLFKTAMDGFFFILEWSGWIFFSCFAPRPPWMINGPPLIASCFRPCFIQSCLSRAANLKDFDFAPGRIRNQVFTATCLRTIALTN